MLFDCPGVPVPPKGPPSLSDVKRLPQSTSQLLSQSLTRIYLFLLPYLVGRRFSNVRAIRGNKQCLISFLRILKEDTTAASQSAVLLQKSCKSSIQASKDFALKSLAEWVAGASGRVVHVPLEHTSGAARRGSHTPVPLSLEVFWTKRSAVKLSIEPAEHSDFGGAQSFEPTVEEKISAN
jgi:hypothetical protein